MAKPIHYRPTIDGLRAIAVLLVIGFHAFAGFIPGGFIGVDVFFVISGFLISGILYRDFAATGAKGFSVIGRFYRRRIRRIFPALAVVLAASYVIGYRLLFAESFKNLCATILASAGFCMNLVASRQAGYFEPDTQLRPLLHMWSLGVEEQFYLLWPLLVWIGVRTRRWCGPILVFLTGCSFFLYRYRFGELPAQAFFYPWARFWELSLGSLAAIAFPYSEAWFGRATHPRFRRAVAEVATVLGIGLIVAAVFLITPATQIPGPWALLPTLGAALVLLAGESAPTCRTILSSSPAVGIGLISYPLYLWHWPLLIFSRLTWEDGDNRVHRMVAVAVAFVLAYLTWRWVEVPLRRGKREGRAILIASGAVVAVAFVAIATLQAGGLPGRFPKFVRDLDHFEFNYDHGTSYRSGTYFLPAESSGSDFRVDPNEVDPRKHTIFLWGDSHAAQLYPGVLKRYGGRYNIVQRTAINTGPFYGVDFPEHPFLRALNDYDFATIRRIHPEVVVLAADWYYYGHWSSAVEKSIRALQGIGIKHIVVAGPVPHWPTSLPQQFLIYYRTHPGASFPDRLPRGDFEGTLDVDAQLSELCRNLGVVYLPSFRLLRDERGYITRFGDRADEIEAWDHDHLTARASEYLVAKFPEFEPGG